jgi:uncharacterized coiled-coil protein SlyX
MDKASEVIFDLKPVSFRYNKEYDSTQRLSFGLVAEDVAEVAPELVGRNKKGEPESVRYEQINAMLLNEFLKAHKTAQELKCTVAKQDATIADLKSTVAKQEAAFDQQQRRMDVFTAQLKRQAAQIQGLNAQIQLAKYAQPIVLNNP